MLYDVVAQHLEKVRYFCRVVEVGSIKKAAAELAISQPALSRMIQTLEHHLDRVLLLRTARGVVPTKEGEQICIFGRKLAQLTFGHFSDTGEVTSFANSGIKIGTYDSIAVYYLSRLLEAIGWRFNGLRVDLKICRSRELVELVTDGKIDLILAVNVKSTTDLCVQTLFTDHYSFYVNALIDMNEDLPLIFVPDACDARGTALSKRVKSYRPRQVILTENFETVKALTVQGLGIGLLPDYVAHTTNGKLIKQSIFPGKPVTFGAHTIDLAFAGARAGVAVKAVSQFIQMHARSWR